MKDSFILYNKYQEVFEELSDEDAGKLIKAILEYSNTGICTLGGVLKAVFTSIKQDIDYNNKKYEEKCEKNRENIAKRWRNKDVEDTNEQNPDTQNTNVCNGTRNDTTDIQTDTKNTEYEYDYEYDFNTKLNYTFNSIINKDYENLKIEKYELDIFDSTIKRLDFQISEDSVSMMPDESLLKFKVIYYSLFSLFFSSYQCYFDTLTRQKVVNKFHKTEKYRGRLKSIKPANIEEFVGYFIKCLQDDFDKKT